MPFKREAVSVQELKSIDNSKMANFLYVADLKMLIFNADEQQKSREFVRIRKAHASAFGRAPQAWAFLIPAFNRFRSKNPAPSFCV
jgi:hypothetical protein